jgi:hypothetical protein
MGANPWGVERLGLIMYLVLPSFVTAEIQQKYSSSRSRQTLERGMKGLRGIPNSGEFGYY